MSEAQKRLKIDLKLLKRVKAWQQTPEGQGHRERGETKMEMKIWRCLTSTPAPFTHLHTLSLPPLCLFLSPLSLSLPSIFIIQDASPVVYGYVRFMSFLAPSSVCVRVCVNRPTLKQIALAVGCWNERMSSVWVEGGSLKCVCLQLFLQTSLCADWKKASLLINQTTNQRFFCLRISFFSTEQRGELCVWRYVQSGLYVAYVLTCKSTPVLVKDGSYSSFSLDCRRASTAPCLGLSHGYWVSQLKLCAQRSHGNPSKFFTLSLRTLDTEATEEDTKEFPLTMGFEIILHPQCDRVLSCCKWKGCKIHHKWRTFCDVCSFMWSKWKEFKPSP